VTEFITVSNPIPETVLAGRWEVAPHESDPPHTPYDHAWISFEPVKFEGNEAVCEITVDTSQLLADETYTRQVLLRTNSQPDTHPIAIEVKTAPLPTPKRTPSLSADEGGLGFMLFFVFAGWLLGGLWDNIFGLALLWGIATTGIAVFATVEKTMMAEAEGIEAKAFQTVDRAVFGAVIGATLGAVAETWMVSTHIGFLMVAVGLMMGTLVGALAPDIKKNYQTATRVLTGCAVVGMLLVAVVIKNPVAVLVIAFIFLVEYPIALLYWRTLKALVSAKIPNMLRRGYYKKDAVIITLLTAGFCISLGAGLQLYLKIVVPYLDWVKPLELAAVAGTAIAGLSATAIPLLNLILFKRSRIIAEYRKSEPDLIKP
jgi:hypothetical protein